MKHTEEPWEVHKLGEQVGATVGDYAIRGDGAWICESVGGRGTRDIHGDIQRVDLERIVACVNALSDLNPAGVKGMVEAATAVIDRWDSPDWKIQAPTADAMNALRTALANLKGPAAQAVIDAGGKQ